MIVMQKSNSIAEVEYIDKLENASPTDGTEQQHRKFDQELDLTAPPQAPVDDLNHDPEKLKLNLSDNADEVNVPNLVSIDSKMNMANPFSYN